VVGSGVVVVGSGVVVVGSGVVVVGSGVVVVGAGVVVVGAGVVVVGAGVVVVGAGVVVVGAGVVVVVHDGSAIQKGGVHLVPSALHPFVGEGILQLGHSIAALLTSKANSSHPQSSLPVITTFSHGCASCTSSSVRQGSSLQQTHSNPPRHSPVPSPQSIA